MSSSPTLFPVVDGDAWDMPSCKPGDFDLVFIDTVIEQMGNAQKKLVFTHEVLRRSR